MALVLGMQLWRHGPKWPHPRSHMFYIDSYRENSSNISSETTGPIKAKLRMDPQWIGGTEAYWPHLGHMT